MISFVVPVYEIKIISYYFQLVIVREGKAKNDTNSILAPSSVDITPISILWQKSRQPQWNNHQYHHRRDQNDHFHTDCSWPPSGIYHEKSLVDKPTHEASSILITIIVYCFCQIGPQTNTWGILNPHHHHCLSLLPNWPGLWFPLIHPCIQWCQEVRCQISKSKGFFSQKVKSLKPGRLKAPDQPRARYVLRRTRVNFAYSI